MPTAVWIPLAIAIILLVPVIIAILWAIACYNGLIRTRRQKDEAWSGINVQLKKRHDLIPNLLETVKAYANHEQDTLTSVIGARSSAMPTPTAENINVMGRQENAITSALGKIFAVAESYPDLKANQNFMSLQKTLTETEEAIQMSRRYFNGSVREYNIKVESFPGVLVARVCGFTISPFFELEDQNEAKTPEIKF